MAMEVLLMKTVASLGTEGQVVRVADGYARNFLFPKKLAAPVTEATRRQLATRQRAREAAEREAAVQAQALAAKLAGVSVTLAVKTSDGEHLYGSISPADVAEALKPQGFDIDRQRIELPDHIRELGVFEAKIRLAAEQEATIKVWVVEE